MDLLEEARLNYPIGTKYICGYTCHEYTIEDPSFDLLADHLISTNIGGGEKGYVLFAGKWAKIIGNIAITYEIY